MPVTVSPQTYRFVFFDSAVIERIAADLADRLGLGDLPLHIDIDESTPLARTRVQDEGAAVTIGLDSGAIEDTRLPRHLSPTAAAMTIGRLLLRVRDRRDPAFADAPADAELDLARTSAWNAHSAGRLARLGYPVNQQRWRYDFRNRHGFSDRADASFDTLWTAEWLAWTDISGLSDAARHLDQAVAH